MPSRKILIVVVALTLIPAAGCKKKSNTVQQTQSVGSAEPSSEATPGSNTNPNMPNPSHAAEAAPMAPGPGPGGGVPVGDAGLDAMGSGSAQHGAAGSAQHGAAGSAH